MVALLEAETVEHHDNSCNTPKKFTQIYINTHHTNY
jgi:hypothetical protein